MKNTSSGEGRQGGPQPGFRGVVSFHTCFILVSYLFHTCFIRRATGDQSGRESPRTCTVEFYDVEADVGPHRTEAAYGSARFRRPIQIQIFTDCVEVLLLVLVCLCMFCCLCVCVCLHAVVYFCEFVLCFENHWKNVFTRRCTIDGKGG